MSTAELVREHVEGAPLRSFIEPADLPGSRRAVECELSRLVAKGHVTRVRKGLYWKGPQTPAGMPLPRAFEVGMKIAGAGAGPAGVSAAAFLGLTTQVPAVEMIAIAGRVRTPPTGVRFVSRSIERRFLGLWAEEIAVLEVLRDGPSRIEWPRTDFTAVLGDLELDGQIRPCLINEQLTHERHVAARQRWSEFR